MEMQKVTYDRLRRVQQSDARLVSQEDVDIARAKYQEAAASGRDAVHDAQLYENHCAVRRSNNG